MTPRILRRLAGLTVTLVVLLWPVAAHATPGPVPAPAIPNVAGLPGPLADPGAPSLSLGLLNTTPDIAIAGTEFTVSGTGLQPDRDVTLTWGTARVDWWLDPRVDSVDYLGRKTTKLTVFLGRAHTDASGAFNLTVRAPQDWGGLHDIYAVVDGVQVAKGGFLIARHATMTPKRGPIGTPITITYYGLGSSLYEGSASLTYDNKFVGQLTANWSRGVAVAHIRAAGPVGKHIIYLDNAVNYGYLNVPQSPLPWTVGHKFVFTVTKDAGRPKPEIDWPVNVAPTVSTLTTIGGGAAAGGRSTASAGSTSASLSVTSGAVHTQVAVTAGGLAPGPVDLVWATVVGNRVNCSGTCWVAATVPLGKAAAGADGTLSAKITVPDGLGGWHAVQLVQGNDVKAQLPFYVKRSFASTQPVSDLTLHQGQHFTIHLKGLGWTQLDNTIAVDYDNAYIGYGCGFNSQGDVVLDLTATGAPGTHLIDMYPLLYTQQPSYASTPYGMIPMLSYRTDLPGLALGYQLPAMRLAITVVR